MRLSNAYAGAALTAALLVLSSYSQAAPDISASAQGGCPTQGELERALAERGLRVGTSEYQVVSQFRAEEVAVELIRNGTEVLLVRRFASGDCRAVAEAAAVVVEAYFVEVRGWSRRVQADEPPDASTPVAVQSNALPRNSVPSAARTESPAAAVSTSGVNRGVTRVNHPARAPARDATVPHGSPAIRATIFAGVGPTLLLPRAVLSAQIEAGVGFELPRVPFATELQLGTALPTVSGGEPNRVRRWASQFLLRIGVPFGSSTRYRPWVGLGGTRSEVRALDVPLSPTRTTNAALIGAGFEVAWPIGSGWLGRVDSSCLVLTARDSYRVEPDGEIGRGPRVVCSSVLGLRLSR